MENSLINSKQKITSPTGNHCQVQMNLHILHVFLCFHLSCQRSVFSLHSFQCDVSKTIVTLRKIQCTTAYQKNNHLASGGKFNSIRLNKPTKARTLKVKFYTPSLRLHYCEREIKGTMLRARGTMPAAAAAAPPGFY